MTNRPSTLWFVALIGASIAICWHPLLDTFRLALTSQAHTHILLILPLSAALAFTQRRSESDAVAPGKLAGYFPLTIALFIGIAEKWGHFANLSDLRLSFSVFAIVTWWIGSLVACYGRTMLRAYLFPALFLYWLVPLPNIALDKIISSLQILSAYAAHFLLLLGRIPVTQDGTLLSMPGLDVDVAPQCSSIRSSLLLVITTMVLAHLFLRSWQRKAILVAAAVPLAALKNGLRIFTLIEIGTHYDPGIFDSDLHHRGGIVFFAISVLLTLILLWVLKRADKAEARKLNVARGTS